MSDLCAGAMFDAKMTSLAEPERRAFNVCEMPSEYFPDLVTRLRLLMMDSRALVRFFLPMSKRLGQRDRTEYLKNCTELFFFFHKEVIVNFGG